MKSIVNKAATTPRRRIGEGVADRHLDGETRRQRSDGVEARERLLLTALRLFAEKGYAKTSTREIAQAAGANIAAISYYFGDKAGLYRAVFIEPQGSVSDKVKLYDQAHFTLRQSLQGFFASFLEPMKQGDLAQLCIRLHFREMVEPTGLWDEEINNDIKPGHLALVSVLGRHLGLARADDDLHRLAFSMVGLALQIFIGRDVILSIRPKLIGSAPMIDEWTERMVEYGEAMMAAEAARRRNADKNKITKKKKT